MLLKDESWRWWTMALSLMTLAFDICADLVARRIGLSLE